jgi:hypothetical protein
LANNTKKTLNPSRNRSFLNKDFIDFRSALVDYAKTYFPDRIQDFSESSLAGLLVDLAAYVGDVNSFYIDHQFRELDPELAVERANIENLARNAGVKITGASPAVASVDFSLIIPAEQKGSTYRPQQAALPIIRKNTTLISDGEIIFSLVEDIDFSEKNTLGELVAEVQVSEFNSDGTPLNYLLTRSGQCVSGERTSETFDIPDNNVPFRTITLGKTNTSAILDVRDLDGNIYYEVDSLSQDTVFRAVENIDDDDKLVSDKVEVMPAPYRFVTQTSSSTRITTLRFGSGNAGTLDGDLVPDPSELALPLYGKKVFSRFTVDPNNLLKTKTLGISPSNTTLTVQYRSGGGISHNVSPRSITTAGGLIIDFLESPSTSVAFSVRSSLSLTNEQAASGGSNAPTLEEIRSLISASRNLQNRIVTKQDLLARIYTMPANFGRVFRAGVSPNSRNPLATELYIVSRDGSGNLTLSPDTLKKNLSVFLDQYRLVSDAIDILDAKVVNVGIDFEVTVDPNFESEAVLSRAIGKIIEYTRVENFQIGQPITMSQIQNLIFNTPGVVSVINMKFVNLSGNLNNREYSNFVYNIPNHTRKGLVIPPIGGIFEVKFPSFDIRGSAV